MSILKKAKTDAEFVELMRPFLHKCKPVGSGKLIDRLLNISRQGVAVGDLLEAAKLVDALLCARGITGNEPELLRSAIARFQTIPTQESMGGENG